MKGSVEASPHEAGVDNVRLPASNESYRLPIDSINIQRDTTLFTDSTKIVYNCSLAEVRTSPEKAELERTLCGESEGCLE